MNNFIASAFAKVHAAAVSRKGADSLEWVGVAVLIIAGVIIAFGIISGGLSELANGVVNRIKGVS